MHHIQERCPTNGYHISMQDGELDVNAVLHRIADNKSCHMLLTMLPGDVTKLASILMASAAPTTTASAGTAAMQNNNGKKDHTIGA